jgi:hypothetical protein
VSASIIIPGHGTADTPCTATASPRSALSRAERDELFALLDSHFDGVIATQFARDLDEKDWVLRIRRDDRLVGFTTLKVYSTRFDQGRVNVIYSGDTITEPEVWGSPVLGRTWVPLVRRLVAERPAEPWYWLLLSSGFRTYRFLPIFFREFWPRYDAPTPARLTAMMTHLARERFGALFDAASGVVRFEHPQRLREQLATVPEGKRHDPHVAFFLERNPAHGDGDELVCLTALNDDNFSAAGRRMMRDRSR